MTWTVTITPLDRSPVHGDRGKTHRVVAIHSSGRRVIRRDLTTVEAESFDPETAWAVQVAEWRSRRS